VANLVVVQENTLDLLVKEIIPETSDTSTYILEPVADGPGFTYQPGQFLTFLLNPKETTNDEVQPGTRTVRRSYSMSSTLGVDSLPAVTIKRVPNGEILRYWHEYVKVGIALKSPLPAGLRLMRMKESPVISYSLGREAVSLPYFLF
jgi:ring-1,2-phenylacetyl-CoA epoxidase subunit PaaE